MLVKNIVFVFILMSVTGRLHKKGMKKFLSEFNELIDIYFTEFPVLTAVCSNGAFARLSIVLGSV